MDFAPTMISGIYVGVNFIFTLEKIKTALSSHESSFLASSAFFWRGRSSLFAPIISLMDYIKGIQNSSPGTTGWQVTYRREGRWRLGQLVGTVGFQINPRAQIAGDSGYLCFDVSKRSHCQYPFGMLSGFTGVDVAQRVLDVR